MSLVPSKLAQDVYDAFNSGQGSLDSSAQWRISQKLATAIDTFVKSATVKTTLDPTCMASGGTCTPSGPVAGAKVNGTTTGLPNSGLS